MNSNTYLVLLITILLLNTDGFTQRTCDELAKYRDEKLYKEFESALNQYEFSSEKKQQYIKFKQECLDIEFGTLTKTFGEAVMHIGAFCNLAKEMLGIMPQGQVVSKGEKLAFFTSDIINKYLLEGKPMTTIVRELAVSKAIDNFSPAATATKAIFDYYEELKAIKQFSDGGAELIKKIQSDIKIFDEAIKEYEVKMKDKQEILNYLNKVKSGIDKYCGSTPVVKITSNKDCYFSIDFGKKVLLMENEIKEIVLNRGEYSIIATSIKDELTYNNKFIVESNLHNAQLIKISFVINKDSIKICDSYDNCGYYKGTIVNGKANGSGACKYKNSGVYSGEYKDNLRDGKGTWIGDNSNKYTGMWKNDKYHGQGSLVFFDGSKYIGEFVDGDFTGYGKYFFKGGGTYDGQWKNNEKSGTGIETYTDGSTYEGEFLNNKKHGQGTGSFGNSKYVGEWKDDKIEGYGTMTHANGEKFVGEWKNNKQYNGTGYLNGALNYKYTNGVISYY